MNSHIASVLFNFFSYKQQIIDNRDIYICIIKRKMSMFPVFIVAVLLVFLSSLSISNAYSVALEAITSKPALNGMFLRGSACGLNWSRGVQMTLVDSIGGGGGYHYKYTATCDDIYPSEVSVLEVKVLDNDDKRWMLGANHHVYLKTNNNISSTFFPWFCTYETPQEVIKGVLSKELNNTRDIIMYLPPSYNENTLKKYKNVMIMHDGQNLFNPQTSAFGCWNAQNALNSAIIGGKTDEIVVIGVYNTPDRNNEYTYIFDPSEGFGGKGDLYLDYLQSTVIPLIQKMYPRLEIQRDTLGIFGSSLGGLISCYAGWTRSAVYGKIGCMSSSFWWDNQDFQKNVITKSNPASSNPSLPVVYMDSGTGSKGERDYTQYTKEIFNYDLSVGFTEDVNVFDYVQEGGTHDEASWGGRLEIPLIDLYPASTV